MGDCKLPEFHIGFSLQKAAFRAGFETLLAGVVSFTSNEGTHPACGG